MLWCVREDVTAFCQPPHHCPLSAVRSIQTRDTMKRKFICLFNCNEVHDYGARTRTYRRSNETIANKNEKKNNISEFVNRTRRRDSYSHSRHTVRLFLFLCNRILWWALFFSLVSFFSSSVSCWKIHTVSHSRTVFPFPTFFFEITRRFDRNFFFLFFGDSYDD